MSNTGNKVFLTLIEKYSSNNLPTGFTKPNLPTDPDYIPPFEDLITCALETTTTTTVNNCGSLGFNVGAYFEIETEEVGSFFWYLPVNLLSISSITSWSIRVQTSQSCRLPNGFISSQLNSWDVIANGIGNLATSIVGDGISMSGSIFNGSFIFNPFPSLAFSPNPCGGVKKVWQNQTTITLTINYNDLCNNLQTYSSVSYIPPYRVSITVGSGGGTTSSSCLLEDTNILLSNNDEKLIQHIVPGDILRGVKLSKEKFHYDTFKDSLFIGVEVERVDVFNSKVLLDVLGLYMTPTHKHLVLRQVDTCWVVEAKDLVKGDKIYDFEKMKFIEIKEIKEVHGDFLVYNIQIKGDFKFYFANNQLTHNKTILPTPPSTIS